MSAMGNSEQLWGLQAAPVAAVVPMADWWRRLAALIVDVAVLWIPLGFLTRDMDRIPGLSAGVAFGVAYFAVLNGSRRGQTLGKVVWEIKVRDAATGGPLGVPRAAVRYLVPALLFLIPILGFVLCLVDGCWPLWDRRRQAMHDKLAGSVVVSAR